MASQVNVALPPAMLIDMDDTILTFTEASSRSWDDLFDRYGAGVPGGRAALVNAAATERQAHWRDPAMHRPNRLDLIGSRRAILTRTLEALNAPNPPQAAHMAHELTEAIMAEMVPFPGAIETINILRAEGVKLALITNGDAKEQRRKIERHALEPLFDVVIVEGEFGTGKPDLAVYHHALSVLGVAPHDAWMVGDNLEWEVVVPQQLGMKGIWVDFAGKGLPPDSPVQPDRIIRFISELLEPESI